MTTSVTEIYDCVFALHCLLEHSQLTTMVDNEKIYKICEDRLGIHNPNYADVNTVIVDHLSAFNASMRFGGTSNKSLNEIAVDLTPYPRIHFVAPSKSPHINPHDTQVSPSVNEMVDSIYDTSSHLLSINMSKDKALCSSLTF